MRNNKVFPTLLLIARPGAGKSEIIDYLKRTPLEERIKRFHIGNLIEIDDFPMLWSWFEQDALLEKMGHPRLFTNEKGYFKHQYYWDLLIERMNLAYEKYLRDAGERAEPTTVVLEFSRGSEHGGFRSAFAHLSSTIASNLAILYIDVSWEESLRKNRARFNPERPDSILEHGLTDEKLEKLYRYSDWEIIRAENPDRIPIQNHAVPYVIFDNQDDVTTARGAALGQRLEQSLAKLWGLFTLR